jgi:hypothetical protein
MKPTNLGSKDQRSRDTSWSLAVRAFDEIETLVGNVPGLRPNDSS